MKKTIYLLVLASAATLCAGTLEFSGEALYWKPSFAGFDYVFEVNDPNEITSVEVSTLKASYSWGFYLAARYETESGCSAWEFGGRYINFDDSARKRGANLTDTFGQLVNGTEIFAQLETDYWTLDFLWTQYLHRDSCMKFWALGGVRYADMNTRLRARSSGGANPTPGGNPRTKADFRGVGPQVGVGGDHCVWGGFKIFGSFDAAVLAARRTYRQDTTNFSFPGITSRLRYSRVWGAVPGLDLRLGISYTYQCGSWFVRGQTGYELNYYWNVNKVRVPFTAQPPVMDDTSFARIDRDLGFGGGFFGLVVGF